MDLIYGITIVGALIICWNAFRVYKLEKALKEIQSIQRGEDVEDGQSY